MWSCWNASLGFPQSMWLICNLFVCVLTFKVVFIIITERFCDQSDTFPSFMGKVWGPITPKNMLTALYNTDAQEWTNDTHLLASHFLEGPLYLPRHSNIIVAWTLTGFKIFQTLTETKGNKIIYEFTGWRLLCIHSPYFLAYHIIHKFEEGFIFLLFSRLFSQATDLSWMCIWLVIFKLSWLDVSFHLAVTLILFFIYLLIRPLACFAD